MIEKRCEGPCGQFKPLDDFPKHGKARDGRMRICLACGEQHGLTSRSKMRQAAVGGPTPPVRSPDAPAVTPLFVTAGAYRFALASIALIDLSEPGQVNIRLNVHEVNAKGYPEALSFSFRGAEAALLLAALDGVTGQANVEVEALRETIRQLETERDAALSLAAEMEQKQQALRAALGV